MVFIYPEQVTAPFEIGFTMKEEDFEEYSVALQEIIRRLLGNTEGLANSSVLDIKRCVPFSQCIVK